MQHLIAQISPSAQCYLARTNLITTLIPVTVKIVSVQVSNEKQEKKWYFGQAWKINRKIIVMWWQICKSDFMAVFFFGNYFCCFCFVFGSCSSLDNIVYKSNKLKFPTIIAAFHLFIPRIETKRHAKIYEYRMNNAKILSRNEIRVFSSFFQHLPPVLIGNNLHLFSQLCHNIFICL